MKSPESRVSRLSFSHPGLMNIHDCYSSGWRGVNPAVLHFTFYPATATPASASHLIDSAIHTVRDMFGL